MRNATLDLPRDRSSSLLDYQLSMSSMASAPPMVTYGYLYCYSYLRLPIWLPILIIINNNH